VGESRMTQLSRRRVLSLAALTGGLAAAPFSLDACSPSGVKKSTSTGLLRVGWTSEPDTLNPFTFASSASNEILQLVYDYLMVYDLDLHPAPGLRRPFRRYDEGDVGLVAADLIEPQVCLLPKVELRRRAHARDPGDVGHEGHATRAALSAGAKGPGHHRPEPVRPHGEPCPEGVTPAGVVPNNRSGHAAPLIQQRLDPGSLQHGGAGRPGSGQQLVVEDSA